MSYLRAMDAVEQIGISELSRSTARYIGMAEGGTTIEIVEDGRVIAKIVPVPKYDPDDPLADFYRRGLIQPARESDDLCHIAPYPAPEGSPSVTEELIRMRDEERY